ncbi:glycosyltransferase [Naasia aerilata]|uniref:Glycosyl transferase n=1 Tax=Naasia aerilata TaxID=1162966 RepID=A0ABM8GFJ7_9MICO|nr:glycosyltransferase [Naasia aerilata]BDZ47082.1 glycosyl transferase [Naasia aerilata]
MRILSWHVHSSWTTGFVQGAHDYVIPLGADDSGKVKPYWPAQAVNVPEEELADTEIDVVVLQSMAEVERTERLLGRRLGTDVPAVFVEHNTPRGDVPLSRHPLADRRDIQLVHVTHFNSLMWDNGSAPTTVIEHGVPDPGHLYTGELPRLGFVINEPVRRWRVTGTDLLPAFAAAAPIDAWGIDADRLPAALGDDRVAFAGNLAPWEMYPELARRRAYLHPIRWTSLGLSLIEAMHLGMPVLALATTEAYRAVPPEAGAISMDVDELVAAARVLIADPDEARARGAAARSFALEHYGLPRFLERWDEVLASVAR